MWKRRGNIFKKHHAQVPVVDVNNDGYWRIYYSKRVDNKSHPFYIDVEIGDTLRNIQPGSTSKDEGLLYTYWGGDLTNSSYPKGSHQEL